MKNKKFNQGMSKLMRRGYSKQSAYNSMRGLVKKNRRTHSSRNKNFNFKPWVWGFLILVLFSVTKLYLDLYLKIMVGVIIGFITSRVSENFALSLGLGFLRRHKTTIKVFGLKYRIVWFAILTTIIELLLFG